MRCKKGDLAVFVHGEATANLGKIVRCVRYVGLASFTDCGRPFGAFHAWEVDPPLEGSDGSPTRGCPDSWLRPIRDTDGEDEVTRIARLKDEEEARRQRANVMAPRRQLEHTR